MIDNCLLKSMLEILADLAIVSGSLENAVDLTRMMLQIIAKSSEVCSNLYCYRTIAVLCKVQPSIGTQFKSEILANLKNSLGFRLGDQTGGMSS